jgi:hypothetical protein
LQPYRGCWICETHVGQFLWKQGLRDEYSVLLQFICAAVVLWFFDAVLLNVRRSLSVNVDFRLLFLFADVAFPWFVYADLTSETVALDTPNNVSVFVRDAPAKCASTIRPLSKSEKAPISLFFHTDFHSTQSLMHWREHYRV